MKRGVAAVLFVAVQLVATRPARSDVESPMVTKAMAAYDALDYTRAIELFQQALVETLTRDEMIATRRTLALCHVALDQPELARADFVELLRLDAGFSLDRSVSPRVRIVLDEAREELGASGEITTPPKFGLPSLAVTLDPARPAAGQALSVRAIYPGGIAERLQLFYRTVGQPVFRWVTARPREGGRFEVVVPAPEVTAPGLEYYLALQDELGAPLAGAGTAGQPLTIEVQAPPQVVFYRRRWFLPAAVGAGTATLIAIIVIAIFASRTGDTAVTIVPR